MTLQFTVLALIILGFFLIAATLWSLVNAEASRSWPSTLGTIALSRTLEEHAQSHYGKGITYIPQISYTYGVGDRDYKGDRISFGMPGWKSKAKALAWVSRGCRRRFTTAQARWGSTLSCRLPESIVTAWVVRAKAFVLGFFVI